MSQSQLTKPNTQHHHHHYYRRSAPAAPTSNTATAAAPAPVQKLVIPKPPSKREVGQAGWTLIHSIAANFPAQPTQNDIFQARAFLTAIANLYPCKKCRRHFDRYITASPPDLSSRDAFMLWACAAHNDVNRRNGKQEFPCNMTYLEKRWGDCGCQRNKKN